MAAEALLLFSSQVPLSQFKDISLFLSGRRIQPPLHLPRYHPVALVFSAFKKADVAAALPGFGVLVPSVEAGREGLSTLGGLGVRRAPSWRGRVGVRGRGWGWGDVGERLEMTSGSRDHACHVASGIPPNCRG